MVIGLALVSVCMLAWLACAFRTLIVLVYAGIALGNTFLSGADEALFYGSLRTSGRVDPYPRLTGRVNAISGPLITIDLIVPFLVGALCMVVMLAVVATPKEPPHASQKARAARKPYREIIRQSIASLAARPTLRYPVFYLAVVPLAAFFLESIFVQSQAVLLGVPIAAIGLLIMAGQLINMLGAMWSQSLAAWIGEGRLIYRSPVLIVISLALLAALQVFPALLLIAVIGFVTAVLRPLVMSRIQAEVTNDVRVTLLSMLSLIGSGIMAIKRGCLRSMLCWQSVLAF